MRKENKIYPSTVLGDKAQLSNCCVSRNCNIADKTTLARVTMGLGVKIMEKVRITNCVIMDNLTVTSGCMYGKAESHVTSLQHTCTWLPRVSRTWLYRRHTLKHILMSPASFTFFYILSWSSWSLQCFRVNTISQEKWLSSLVSFIFVQTTYDL